MGNSRRRYRKKSRKSRKSRNKRKSRRKARKARKANSRRKSRKSRRKTKRRKSRRKANSRRKSRKNRRKTKRRKSRKSRKSRNKFGDFKYHEYTLNNKKKGRFNSPNKVKGVYIPEKYAISVPYKYLLSDDNIISLMNTPLAGRGEGNVLNCTCTCAELTGPVGSKGSSRGKKICSKCKCFGFIPLGSEDSEYYDNIYEQLDNSLKKAGSSFYRKSRTPRRSIFE